MSLFSSLKNSWVCKQSWSILYWLPTGIFLSNYFFQLKTVSGRSMQPTLNPDSSRWRDVALFSKFAVHTTREYGRDDIVTLRSPEDPNRVLIKRIIAMEGDTIKTLPPYPDHEITVPQGHVWVEGDEHFVSDDSNRFGPVSQGLIKSKMLMIIWPPDRLGSLKVKADPGTKSSSQKNRRTLDELKREQSRHSRVKMSTTSKHDSEY